MFHVDFLVKGIFYDTVYFQYINNLNLRKQVKERIMFIKRCAILVFCIVCFGSMIATGSLHYTVAARTHTTPASFAHTYDFDELGKSLDDEEGEFEYLDHAPSHWTTWTSCKEGLKALYALLMSKMMLLYKMCMQKSIKS